MVNSRLPHSPTEDTPINGRDFIGPKHEWEQDDKQLRVTTAKELATFILMPHNASMADLDEATEAIAAFVEAAQIQLVSELLEHSREYEVTDLEKLDHWNETPLVVIPASVLEHKKQELERGE